MNKHIFQSTLLVFCLSVLAACDNHFISDSSLREQIHQQWAQRKELFTHGESFSIFDSTLSTQEREAMEVHYSSLPSADLADFDGEYFLENVRYSLKARQEMALGKSVPEDIFRHFVLPV